MKYSQNKNSKILIEGIVYGGFPRTQNKTFLREEIEAPYRKDPYTYEMGADMTHSIHKAASDIHDAWMSRPNNEKQDYNAHLHVPYTALPREEQEKDIDHLRIIQKIHNSTPVPMTHPITGERLTTEEDRQAAHSHLVADEFGRLAHEKWREGFEAKSGKGTPRMKSAIDENGEEISVNINVPWEQLHPQWKDENYQAGLAAHEAFKTHLT
jgi:hypothetical protein